MRNWAQYLKIAIKQGGNLAIRVVKTTRWQRQKGEELLNLVMGKKQVEMGAYFPAPPSAAQEVARWDSGKFDQNKWG